jgi:hypothetical protein
MDADLQDSPEEIQVYTIWLPPNFDLVSGWKRSATIQWLLKPTFKLFNWAARKRLCRTQWFQRVKSL